MFHILFNNFKEKPFGLLPPFFFSLSLLILRSPENFRTKWRFAGERERERKNTHARALTWKWTFAAQYHFYTQVVKKNKFRGNFLFSSAKRSIAFHFQLYYVLLTHLLSKVLNIIKTKPNASFEERGREKKSRAFHVPLNGIVLGVCCFLLFWYLYT
jgi:hypothetical protein